MDSGSWSGMTKVTINSGAASARFVWARGIKHPEVKLEGRVSRQGVTRRILMAVSENVGLRFANSISTSFVNAKAKRRQYKSTASEADKFHG